MSALATARCRPDAQATTCVRLLIADDHPLILAGIRRTLEHSGVVEIVGEAGSGQQLLALIERRAPDMVLLGAELGAELPAEIHRRWPAVRTVVLSAKRDCGTIDMPVATAWIDRRASPARLAAVIDQVASGAPVDAPMRPSPARGAGAGEAVSDSGGTLTRRERTILEAVCAGKTTAAISRELWVSEHTIKFHLTNVYRKLGVSNRAGAIRHALEHGLAR